MINHWSIMPLVIGLTMVVAAPAVTAGSEQPNIVFIMSDDHATRALSAYGNALVQTPNIDRIAANGMRFDRAYVGNAICGPSRATALTGRHSHGNGFYSNEWSGPFDGSQQTFPKLLQAAGYQTALVGKWHLYSDPTGFDHWEVIDNVMEQGSYYNPAFRSPEGVEETTGYVADLVTNKALSWLQGSRNPDRPFLLMYNHKTPHRDWLPGPQELSAWDESLKIEEPATLLRSMDGLTQARQDARMTISQYMTGRDVKLSMPGNLTPAQASLWDNAFAKGNADFEQQEMSEADTVRWRYQRYIKTYAASITSMDRQIGRLLDYLDANGLTRNTIIIYTSDQGFFLGENGWFDKRWMDEVSSRIPLLVQWNHRIVPGQSSQALVQNIDFAPTLLDAAGVVPPATMHGVSLLPLFSETPVQWQRDLYYHYYENPGFHGVARHYGIRTEQYKLIHYYKNNEWELFDLHKDPEDQHNVYGEPAYDAVTVRLREGLDTLRKRYNVPDKDPAAPWYHGTLIRLIEQLLKLQ